MLYKSFKFGDKSAGQLQCYLTHKGKPQGLILRPEVLMAKNYWILFKLLLHKVYMLQQVHITTYNNNQDQ